MPTNYETYADVSGVKYEVVECGFDMFGKRIFQACTFQRVMRPTMERRTLGTFTSRADTIARLNKEIETV